MIWTTRRHTPHQEFLGVSPRPGLVFMTRNSSHSFSDRTLRWIYINFIFIALTRVQQKYKMDEHFIQLVQLFIS